MATLKLTESFLICVPYASDIQLYGRLVTPNPIASQPQSQPNVGEQANVHK